MRRCGGCAGGTISIVFQDALSGLNPVFPIGVQLTSVVRAHRRVSAGAARDIAVETLELVGIRDAGKRLEQYPHQFSGGMRQRVLIAMAVACHPRLLIADEPTTALDVTVQAQIVTLLQDLRQRLGIGLLFITHNLDLMAQICDRAIVLYGGMVMEDGLVGTLFDAPKQPYTRALIECKCTRLSDRAGDFAADPGEFSGAGGTGRRLSVSARAAPNSWIVAPPNGLRWCRRIRIAWPVGTPFSDRAPAGTCRCRQDLSDEPGLAAAACWDGGKSIPHLDDVSLSVPRGGGVLGLGRRERLRQVDDGAPDPADGATDDRQCLRFPMARCSTGLSNTALGPYRRRMQMVFQDAGASLNPRARRSAIWLDESLALIGLPRADRTDRAVELLSQVGLDSGLLGRFPHQLSGGQRQRMAIARALAVGPDLLVADEPVSSLDVSLQAQIMLLLTELRDRLGLTMVFISHDLALVHHICSTVAVMHGGRIVERGLPGEVLRNPKHDYTRRLLDAVPRRRKLARIPV